MVKVLVPPTGRFYISGEYASGAFTPDTTDPQTSISGYSGAITNDSAMNDGLNAYCVDIYPDTHTDITICCYLPKPQLLELKKSITITKAS
jgi:hypothetical protein